MLTVLTGAPPGFKFSVQRNHLRHLTPTAVIFEHLPCTGHYDVLFTCILSIPRILYGVGPITPFIGGKTEAVFCENK